MRAVLTVPGRFPSLNDYVSAERSDRQAGARMKREETDRVAWEALSQRVPAFTEPVAVRILWVEPNRRRDLDNVAFAAKFVLDGLVRAGILQDDSQRWVRALQHTFEVDPDAPRVVVELDGLGDCDAQ